jgi:demethylmenaquinone methyltransferase/2-methoxy-6-polyprenyl-1,4-benzoquinol methylase
MQPSGAVKDYYDARAPEYDDWYLGVGRFAARERPGWHEELAVVETVLAAMPPARTLDVACGTGFLTQHLRGHLTVLDQSERMLAIAAERLRQATLVRGDALALPFDDRTFDRVFAGHFYGHLAGEDRKRFLAEARRLAPELVIVDSALRTGVEPEESQQRKLNDGSRYEVYKRYFDAPALAAELGGGAVLHAGDWFVAVRSIGLSRSITRETPYDHMSRRPAVALGDVLERLDHRARGRGDARA